jgi:hypothetical protein
MTMIFAKIKNGPLFEKLISIRGCNSFHQGSGNIEPSKMQRHGGMMNHIKLLTDQEMKALLGGSNEGPNQAPPPPPVTAVQALDTNPYG